MSIELLNKRLRYQGGNQQQRFIRDKLMGLKQALLYSYQAATAVLSDGKQFRCLINPDKNKPAYDNKIISIPFKDICLNAPKVGKRTEGQVEINMKPGDVFEWKQTFTYWLVYLKYLQEDAYFRAEIRRCDQQIQIDNTSYWVYIRGPVETAIQWRQKAGIEWNKLNFSLVLYITADEKTNNFFSRFQNIKILDPRSNTKKTWQVVGVDPYYGDGILQIFLDEYFENPLQDLRLEKEKEKENIIEQNDGSPYIEGPIEVKQYSKAYYQIKNCEEEGSWIIIQNEIENNLNYNNKILPLNIDSGKLGTFTLVYRVENQEDVKINVKVVSL